MYNKIWTALFVVLLIAGGIRADLNNGDFELPGGTGRIDASGDWTQSGTTHKIQQAGWAANSGSHGVWMPGWDPNKDEFFYQDTVISAGAAYVLDADFKITSNFTPNGGQVELIAIWLDNSQTEISRNTLDVDAAVTGTSWETLSIETNAPAGAETVRVMVHWSTDAVIENGSDSAAFVDNISVHPPQTLFLSNLFSDHMVLQRGFPIPVWGTAVPGDVVTVSLSTGETTNTTAGAGGNWDVEFPAKPAGGPAITLTVTSPGQQTVISNIAIGDVWLCSGQSNMEWGLSGTTDGAAEIAAANYPNLRHQDTPNAYASTPQDEPGTPANWLVCSPSSAGSFSGVAYYFGKRIHLNEGIPIGLINCTWGGTRIEPWSPVPVPNAMTGTGVQESTVLYNQMIHPYTRMPIKGAIWYQGEANVGNGSLYTAKMETLVSEWRSAWGIGDFPFYFVQIAPFDYGGSAVYNVPELWAAQTAAMTSISNSGMAVINDVGNISDIHPRDKEPVGERLALWARYGTYGETNLVHAGPMAREIQREGSQLRISFDHVGTGLASRDAQPLDWFEIADSSLVYTQATATIDGDTVVVSGPGISEPEWVRFAWHETAEPNLMNVEGLPANSFSARREHPRPFSGELLQNGDVEIGTVTGWMPETFDAPPWSREGGDPRNAWLTDDSHYPILGVGNQALIIRWEVTTAYQEFDVVPDEEYTFSVEGMVDRLGGVWLPTLQVQWFDTFGSSLGSPATLDQIDALDPEDTWIPLSGTVTAPSGAATARIVLCVKKDPSGSGGFGYFDNASVSGALDGITYENWAIENGLAGNPLDDDEPDGATLLEEYAFNLNPAVIDGGILVSPAGTNGLPRLSFDGTQLQVEYLRRKEAQNLDYVVEVSTNLVDWTPASNITVVASIDNEWERVVEKDPVAATNAPGARFIRMQLRQL